MEAWKKKETDSKEAEEGKSCDGKASLGYLGVWILSQKEKRCGGVCLSSQPGEMGVGGELGPREALFLEIISGCGARSREVS